MKAIGIWVDDNYGVLQMASTELKNGNFYTVLSIRIDQVSQSVPLSSFDLVLLWCSVPDFDEERVAEAKTDALETLKLMKVKEWCFWGECNSNAGWSSLRSLLGCAQESICIFCQNDIALPFDHQNNDMAWAVVDLQLSASNPADMEGFTVCQNLKQSNSSCRTLLYSGNPQLHANVKKYERTRGLCIDCFTVKDPIQRLETNPIQKQGENGKVNFWTDEIFFDNIRRLLLEWGRDWVDRETFASTRFLNQLMLQRAVRPLTHQGKPYFLNGVRTEPYPDYVKWVSWLIDKLQEEAVEYCERFGTEMSSQFKEFSTEVSDKYLGNCALQNDPHAMRVWTKQMVNRFFVRFPVDAEVSLPDLYDIATLNVHQAETLILAHKDVDGSGGLRENPLKAYVPVSLIASAIFEPTRRNAQANNVWIQTMSCKSDIDSRLVVAIANDGRSFRNVETLQSAVRRNLSKLSDFLQLYMITKFASGERKLWEVLRDGNLREIFGTRVRLFDSEISLEGDFNTAYILIVPTVDEVG